MTERVVAINLLARVQGFIVGFRQAQAAAADLGRELSKADKYERQFNLVGTALLGIGVAAAAGVGLAVKAYADFDKAMSAVQAATHESAGAMDSLTDAALAAGQRTVFSATEAANAVEELAKAGVSTADILGGALDGALDLASAGGLGVADAAGIAATALQQFGLKGTDMAHVADLLAAGAGKAMGDVTDLSEALKYVGPVAASMKISIEETTGALALFASQGILGEQAGTSLRGVLSSLTSPSQSAQKEMERLGITLYDNQGKFLGLSNMAGQLKTAYSGLTDEQRDFSLGVIFGNQQVTAARVLYQGGAEAIDDWTNKVDDAGYAAETAATRLDNLSGDLEQLRGAMETAFIKTGSAGNDVLRQQVQILVDLVNTYNNLPPSLQSVSLEIGVLVAAVGLAGGAFFLAAPKIVAFREATATLNAELPRASRLLGGLGSATAVIGALSLAGEVVQGFIGQLAELSSTSEEVSNSFKTAASSTALLSDVSTVRVGLLTSEMRSAIGSVKDLGNAIDQASSGRDTRGWEWIADLTSFATMQDADVYVNQLLNTFEALGSEMANQVKSGNLRLVQDRMRELAEEGNLTNEQILKQIKLSPELSAALTGIATEAGKTASDQNILAIALGKGEWGASRQADALWGVEDAATDAGFQISDLEDRIRNFGSAQFDTERATIGFYDAVDGLTSALQAEGASLDVTTEGGRQVRQAMLDVADSTNQYAGSVAAMGGSTEQVQAVLEDGRQRIIDTRMALGETREAAQLYADQLISTPAMIQTTMDLNIDPAVRRLQEIKNSFAAFQASGLTITAYVRSVDGAFASGGTVYGPGTSKSDSVPILASRGEEIIQEPYATQYRGILKQINRGQFRGFADGGTVYMPSAPAPAAIHFDPASGGDTFQASFQLAPLPGRSLADQAFEAARRLHIRRRG